MSKFQVNWKWCYFSCVCLFKYVCMHMPLQVWSSEDNLSKFVPSSLATPVFTHWASPPHHHHWDRVSLEALDVLELTMIMLAPNSRDHPPPASQALGLRVWAVTPSFMFKYWVSTNCQVVPNSDTSLVKCISYGWQWWALKATVGCTLRLPQLLHSPLLTLSSIDYNHR